MKLRRTALACCAPLVAALLAGCATSATADATSRQTNPNAPREGIGPAAESGPAPRNMPADGRGSESPFKSKR